MPQLLRECSGAADQRSGKRNKARQREDQSTSGLRSSLCMMGGGALLMSVHYLLVCAVHERQIALAKDETHWVWR